MKFLSILKGFILKYIEKIEDFLYENCYPGLIKHMKKK
jgi:hypothetical protein